MMGFHKDESLENKTVVVQGFGNVGSYSAYHFHKNKSKVIAIIEHDCAIHNPEGFDIPDLMLYFKENKTLVGYPDAVST